MATKQKQAQRMRTSRRSKGTSIGSRKNPQDELTLIIQGKGIGSSGGAKKSIRKLYKD